MLNILFCIFHALKYDSIVSTEHSFWAVWILFGCFLLGFHNKVRLRVVTGCTLQFINCRRARASARNRRRWKAALNLHLKWSLTSSLIHLKTAPRWVQNRATTHVCTHARGCVITQMRWRAAERGHRRFDVTVILDKCPHLPSSAAMLTGPGDPLTGAGVRVLQIWQKWAGSNQKLLLNEFKFVHNSWIFVLTLLPSHTWLMRPLSRKHAGLPGEFLATWSSSSSSCRVSFLSN